jgi:Helix-turn-helix domain
MSKPKYEPMSEDEALALPVSVDLETAGRAFGFGRTKAHELARAGEFPCAVKLIGKRYRVLRADLLPALGIDPLTTTGPMQVLRENVA